MSCIQWLSSNRFILDKSVTFMFYCPQKKFGILTLVEKVYFVTKLLPQSKMKVTKSLKRGQFPQYRKSEK